MKNRMKKMISILMAGAVFMTGVPALAMVQEAPTLSETFVNNSTDMSFDLLRQINASDKTANLVFSPVGIQYVLGILNNAADDTTHKNINAVWKYPVATGASAINTELQNKMARAAQFYGGAEGTRFDIANAMYVKPGYPINSTFKKIMDAYKAQIAELDFVQPDAVLTVNKWASTHTNGRIPKIIDQFSDAKNARMVFLNAVNLEARWGWEFNKSSTTKKKFMGNSKTTTVDMMTQGLEYGSYYEDKSVQCMEKRIDGGYSLFVILPQSKDKKALDTVLKKLDSKYLTTMLKGSDSKAVKYEGTLYLPRFNVAYTPKDLAGNLKSLGVDLKSKKANFNKATVKPEYDLILSSLIHKAVIDVNEEGVTASAVTMAEMEDGAALETRKVKKVEMNVNRPFIYGITDRDGSVLFLGLVQNLANAK